MQTMRTREAVSRGNAPATSQSSSIRFYRHSMIVAALLAVASGVGLFVDDFYRDNAFASAAFRGNDLISLAIAVPVLAIAMYLARHGSMRAKLIWLGALSYVAYTYVYTFAIAFNRLFLVYVALLSLSVFTLVGAMRALDFGEIGRRFADPIRERRVRAFLRWIGGLLALVELGQVLPALITGEIPELVTKTGHPTGVVYIADLGLIVPLMFVAGGWIRSRRPWAPVVATILLVKGVTVGLALLSSNLFNYLDGGGTDGPLIGLWVLSAIGSLLVLVDYLRAAGTPRASEGRQGGAP